MAIGSTYAWPRSDTAFAAQLACTSTALSFSAFSRQQTREINNAKVNVSIRALFVMDEAEGPSSSHARTRYKYRGLARDEIRLFKFANDRLNLNLCLRLHAYNLWKAPPYIALSYTWGSSDSHDICCVDDNDNDVPSDAPNDNDRVIEVRTNLLAALQCLSQQPEAYFWIDQITIDQENMDERAEQVKLMGRIYSRAVSVFVWLGQDIWEDTELAALLPEVYDDYHGKIGGMEDTGRRIGSTTNPVVGDEVSVLAHEGDNWRLLTKLYTHPYWTRVWIVQELIMARKLMFLVGGKAFDFPDMAVPVMGIKSFGGEGMSHGDDETLWRTTECFGRIETMMLSLNREIAMGRSPVPSSSVSEGSVPEHVRLALTGQMRRDGSPSRWSSGSSTPDRMRDELVWEAHSPLSEPKRASTPQLVEAEQIRRESSSSPTCLTDEQFRERRVWHANCPANEIPRWTLADLVLQTWDFTATDERDKVYAMLGLLDLESCARQPITVDYTEATYRSLLIETFINSLTHPRGSELEPLRFIRPPFDDPDAQPWPTWIPNPDAARPLFHASLLAEHWQSYDASKDHRCDIQRIDGRRDALRFKVRRLGYVEHFMCMRGIEYEAVIMGIEGASTSFWNPKRNHLYGSFNWQRSREELWIEFKASLATALVTIQWRRFLAGEYSIKLVLLMLC